MNAQYFQVCPSTAGAAAGSATDPLIMAISSPGPAAPGTRYRRSRASLRSPVVHSSVERLSGGRAENPLHIRPIQATQAGTIRKLAKSPPDVLPTQIPTRPFLRSLSWVTVRHGSFASPTWTLTFGLATTTRTWNQSFGSGTGLTGFSYWPGCSARSFSHG